MLTAWNDERRVASCRRGASTSTFRSTRLVGPKSRLLLLLLVALTCLFLPVSGQEAGTANPQECTAEQEDCSAQSPPGLHTPHPQPFTPVPPAVRHTVCLCPWTEMPVLRAFRARNWNIIEIQENPESTDPIYLECHQKGQAALIWTKNRLPDWWQAQPWQRHNWLPMVGEILVCATNSIICSSRFLVLLSLS